MHNVLKEIKLEELKENTLGEEKTCRLKVSKFIKLILYCLSDVCSWVQKCYKNQYSYK